MSEGSVGVSGNLDIQRVTGRRAHVLDIPYDKARLLIYDAEHEAGQIGNWFSTELHAHHYRPHPRGEHIVNGEPHRLIDERHLGSGTVLNCGVNMLATDPTWITASTPFSTLSAMKYMAIGTGTTASAASDYQLQTPVSNANLTGATNGYMTSTITVVAPNIVQAAATFTCAAVGGLAVTEWILAMSNAASIARTATGTPTLTTFPDSGASFATAGNGLAGWTIEINSTAVNTPTTTVMGLVTSNTPGFTTTSLTLAGGWWTLANASASTPGVNPAYVLYPTAWDHKVFAAINMSQNDTLAFTYKDTATSGG